jgi:ZIP family zinc transporter
VVAEPAARAGWGWVVGLVVAVAATLGALVLMRQAGLEGLLRPQPAAIPELAFERVAFAPGELTVSVRNTGPEAMTVAQVAVDDAYRVFSAEPGRRPERLESARLRIPYPWIAGEPLGITVVDSTGTTHAHEVEAAAETPVVGGRTVAGYVVLGACVGLIPVFLGLLFLPALARLGRAGLRFLLGLTGGLLVFLAIDALGESLELVSAWPRCSRAGPSSSPGRWAPTPLWPTLAAGAAGRVNRPPAHRPSPSPTSWPWGSDCTTSGRVWPSARPRPGVRSPSVPR